MSDWSALDAYEVIIRRLVEDQSYSFKQVREILRNQYGLENGSSLSSISKFCVRKNIHRYDYSLLGQHDVEAVVAPAVAVCGPVCGRKMMTGMLRASGYRLGERVVRRSDPTVYPDAQRGDGSPNKSTPLLCGVRGA